MFRKTYNLVTEDAADSKDGIVDDELLQHGIQFSAKVNLALFLLGMSKIFYFKNLILKFRKKFSY